MKKYSRSTIFLSQIKAAFTNKAILIGLAFLITVLLLKQSDPLSIWLLGGAIVLTLVIILTGSLLRITPSNYSDYLHSEAFHLVFKKEDYKRWLKALQENYKLYESRNKNFLDNAVARASAHLDHQNNLIKIFEIQKWAAHSLKDDQKYLELNQKILELENSKPKIVDDVIQSDSETESYLEKLKKQIGEVESALQEITTELEYLEKILK